MNEIPSASFNGLVDLAAERFGGEALAASDEFFAPKENLLKPGRGEFVPELYTDSGKWMDGWETRRRRGPGYDWCIVRLGLAGRIRSLDVDTNHFLGNHPPYASLEACALQDDGDEEGLAASDAWVEVLPRSPLGPGRQNLFAVSDDRRFTHVRLNIYPDGGVARLRVYGLVRPDWRRLRAGEAIDLAAVENGGVAVAASDMFFSRAENLLMPGAPENMGDGWETRRRRGPGYDWVVVRLGTVGRLERLEVDTRCFKGNYPDRVSFEGCREPRQAIDALTLGEAEWRPILPETRLGPDAVHVFDREITDRGPWSHVRMNVFPDGGVGRLRIYGRIDAEPV